MDFRAIQLAFTKLPPKRTKKHAAVVFVISHVPPTRSPSHRSRAHSYDEISLTPAFARAHQPLAHKRSIAQWTHTPFIRRCTSTTIVVVVLFRTHMTISSPLLPDRAPRHPNFIRRLAASQLTLPRSAILTYPSRPHRRTTLPSTLSSTLPSTFPSTSIRRPCR